jgi:hypothetical protein
MVKVFDWKADRTEYREDLKQQLCYFIQRIKGLRDSIAPHFNGHTHDGTEECEMEWEKYRESLQNKFRLLDLTLDDLTLILIRAVDL